MMERSLRRYGRLADIALLITSLSLSLLVGEIVLRAFFPSGYYVWQPGLEETFKPQPGVMPGIYGESRFVINSQGIRGDEFSPEQAYRILAIGGSTTECLYLDQAEAWPYLLQRRLDENAHQHKVWVGNVGKSGQTTRHHILEMRYLLPQYPRVDAVIMLIGGNDLLTRLARDVSYNPRFLDQAGAEEQLLDEAFWSYPKTSLPFYERTAIWRLGGRVRSWGLSLLLQNDRGTVQDDAGNIYVTWREHRRDAATIRNTLPDLSSAVDEYARNTNTIIDLAESRSIRLILVTQPTLWEPGLSRGLADLLWTGGIGDYQREGGKEYYSAEALAEGMEMYNEVLLETCQTRQAECFDLASLLPKDATVHYDDMHFNESGAEQVAEALAEYMFQREPFNEHAEDQER